MLEQCPKIEYIFVGNFKVNRLWQKVKRKQVELNQ